MPEANPFTPPRLVLEEQIAALQARRTAGSRPGQAIRQQLPDGVRDFFALDQQIANLTRQRDILLQKEATWAANIDIPGVASTPSLMDMFYGLNGSGPSSGGGSRTAAAAAAQQAQMRASYQQMLDAINGQYDTTGSGFNAQEARLGQLRDAGASRLAGILQGLQGDAARTRADVAGSFQRGDQALAGMVPQYQQMADAYSQGAAKTLGAFGVQAQRAQPAGGSPLDLIAAQRATLASQAASADAGYANRGNIYAGLNSDVSTGNSQAYDSLLLQLQQQRAAAEAKRAADLAQVRLQAASQGVSL